MKRFKISEEMIKKNGHLKICYANVAFEIEKLIKARGAVEIRNKNKWDASNSGSRISWKALDRLKIYRDFLDGFGVEFEECNDSPKCGFIHDYIKISNRRKLRTALTKAKALIAQEDLEKIKH